jgi:hypothetical protein
MIVISSEQESIVDVCLGSHLIICGYMQDFMSRSTEG